MINTKDTSQLYHVCLLPGGLMWSNENPPIMNYAYCGTLFPSCSPEGFCECKSNRRIESDATAAYHSRMKTRVDNPDFVSEYLARNGVNEIQPGVIYPIRCNVDHCFPATPYVTLSPESHKGDGQEPKIDRRWLVRTFMQLPYHVQIEVAIALGLYEPEQSNFNSLEKQRAWFLKAKQLQKIDALYKKVIEICDPELLPKSKPEEPQKPTLICRKCQSEMITTRIQPEPPHYCEDCGYEFYPEESPAPPSKVEQGEIFPSADDLPKKIARIVFDFNKAGWDFSEKEEIIIVHMIENGIIRFINATPQSTITAELLEALKAAISIGDDTENKFRDLITRAETQKK